MFGFEMLTTEPDRPYTVLGQVQAWQDRGDIETVNNRLIEEAVKLGANGIINLTYERKISWTSWDQLVGTGTAVILESDSSSSKSNPVNIAEQIKELAGLHQSGIISDEEFSQAKAKLLDGS